MSAALGLFRLQQVDRQIDQIQARLIAIQQTLADDVELRTAHEQLSAAEDKHGEAQRALRLSEADVARQQTKIEQTEASLYGGRVHNPKELQDLQRDAASLKRHLETLEERELEAMLIVEGAEKELLAAKMRLENVESGRKVQSLGLTQERETLGRDLERLHSEREAVVTDIAHQVLTAYEQLRRQKRGIAITTIAENACEACGTTLTPSQQQSARSTSQLFHCPTCGRILYAS